MQQVEDDQTVWEAAVTDLETALSSLRTTLADSSHLGHNDCQTDGTCLGLYNDINLLTPLADPTAVCVFDEF